MLAIAVGFELGPGASGVIVVLCELEEVWDAERRLQCNHCSLN
jgi:hypothetical protein